MKSSFPYFNAILSHNTSARPVSCHVIQRILNHRLLSKTPTYDVEYTGFREKAWSLVINAEAPLSHGGQGESLVSPYTRGSVSLSLTWCAISVRP